MAATNGHATGRDILAGILGKLENVQAEKGDHQFNAKCPAHDDGRNSLGVSLGDDDRVLLKCLANCETAAVLDSLGMTLKDLFPKSSNGSASGKKRKEKSFGKLTATYRYEDEHGKLLKEVCRYELDDGEKDFRQRAPKEGGGWNWSTKNIRNTPYHFGELLATKAGDTVYIAEGEKDVDNLRKVELPATTNAGGAGKWPKQFGEYFHGKNAVIFPDNDEAGRKHADQVAKSLKGKVTSVKIIGLPNLPAKGDVSDWLAAGGTKEKLLELVAAAPEWDPSKQPVQKLIEACDEQGSTAVITNGILKNGTVVAFSMKKIIDQIQELTGNWPRRVSSTLFVHEGGGVDWLTEPAALFGYIGSKTGIISKFHNEPGTHPKSEVFAEFRRTATSYSAVETLPHEPLLPDHYYCCNIPAPGNGDKLRGLVSRFSPQTEIDADLILSLFLTIIWGGKGGSRPAYTITSDSGRGAGKSTLSKMLAYLYGGCIELSANENAEIIKQRLLSPEGLGKRIAVLDNVKTMRFSWADLESLITAAVISGKRLYVGEASRPNNLTFIITLNGASYSTDMAQRSVFIKIKRPVHSGSWEDDTRAYIDQYRQEIIADAVGMLRADRGTLGKFSRWGAWEKEVLSRLPEPEEAQRVILERQATADVETEEADIVEDYFAQKLSALTYDTEADRVFIPNAIVCRWFNEATNDRHTTTAVTRTINQKINEGKLERLTESKSRAGGRGFIWVGSEWNADSVTKTDLETRLERNEQRTF